MIKNSEIRIGNVIQGKGGIGIIHSVDPSCGWIKFGGRYGDIRECSYVYIEPIPITPEWLEKMGFESNKASPFFRIDMSIGIGQLSVNPDNGTTWLSKNGNSINPANTQFVHQLQNLYFALTGEELQIKE